MKLDRLRLDRRVSRLLEPFTGTTPGGTIGIVLDGELAIHRSAGMASLELGQPITAQTCFRIASVSKQFTCAAVLKLATEGLLSTEDDLRLHLPELPDLGPISIDMAMRNMSGIRDMLEILRHGGMDLGIPCRPQDLLDAICRQTDTNFPPGERFLYSNSNFMLAGLIVERVSGTSLRDYLQTHFLGPLGMNATHLTPRTTDVVENLATGYLPQDGRFLRAPHAFPLGGEGGLVSSVCDLALWDAALESGEVDLPGLTSQAPFTNGITNPYARGLVVGRHRGVRIEDHGGSWPGFRTAFLRAPDHHATIIAIFNNGATDAGQFAFEALDAVLDARPQVHPVPKMPSQAELAPLAGRYLDTSMLMTLDITVSDQGVVTLIPYGGPMVAKATEDDRLVAGKGAFALMIRPRTDALELELPSGHTQNFIRVTPDAPLPNDLDGIYTCADMLAEWTIAGNTVKVDGPLVRGQDWTVCGIDGDVVRIQVPSLIYPTWLDTRVLHNANGEVTGLAVNGGRTKRLVYTKKASNAAMTASGASSAR